MIAAPILIIFLSLTLGATLIAYDRLLRELRELKTEKGSFEESGRLKAAKIMEEARDKALQILEEAKLDAGENQQKVDGEMERITQMQLDNYNNMIQKISKSIEDEALKEVDEFRKKLKEAEELLDCGTSNVLGYTTRRGLWCQHPPFHLDNTIEKQPGQ